MSTDAAERPAYPGPHDITRITLKNGLTVLVRENHLAPVTVMEGSLRSGSVYVAAEQAGLASLTASMLMRGSENCNYDSFNERIEDVGANFSISSSDHSTDFGYTCLSEDFGSMLSLLSETLQRPLFPDEHLRRLRRQRLVSIQERDQDTSQVANLRFLEAMYGDHPYGRSNIGYEETVQRITRQGMLDFYSDTFGPSSAVIAVSGDVETERVIEQIERQLGAWTGPESLPDIPAPDTRAVQRQLTFELLDKVQADIVMGCPAVARDHPDFHPIRLANTILGRFGMMGRLGERIRGEKGLAYYAYSTYDASPLAGAWFANAGVNPYNAAITIESIMAEFERLGAQMVSSEELADSQAYMTGIVPLALETNEGIANTLLQMEWYGLGLDYLQRYNDIIYSITAEDVQRVAATYLQPDRCLTVLAGPEIKTSDAGNEE